MYTFKQGSIRRYLLFCFLAGSLLWTSGLEAAASEPDSKHTQASSYDVIIVGGGFAGLTAAYCLDDYDIKLLEKESQVGGIVNSGSHRGLAYAKGPEYMGKPDGILKRIIKKLNIEVIEIPSPMDAKYCDGKFYYGDDGLAMAFIQNSSLKEYNSFVSTVRGCMDEYRDIPYLNLESDLAKLDSISAREWFRKNGFSDYYQDHYNVTARGLFGASIDEISALSFIPEIAFDYTAYKPVHDIDDLENSSAKGKHRTKAFTCLRGITEITAGIAEHLGESIQTDATVTEVSGIPGNYKVTYEDKDGNRHVLGSRTVILAVPGPIALKIASPLIGVEQKRLLKQIEYSSYITVAMFTETPVFEKAFDLAVPDGWFFTDIYDSTWVEKFYSKKAATNGAFVISAYIAPDSYKERTLLELSDTEVMERVYRDLKRIWPDIRDRITGYDIQRFPYAYPVMTLGAYHRLTRLNELNKGGLLLAGQYMSYPTFEAAVESGELAADKAEEALEMLEE